jgi:glycosyltransferase involved in cell wall biosynthesis
MRQPALRILGTRGVPAAHGGFETFAEHLSLHLVNRGWKVTVYCQEPGSGPIVEDSWQGVHRVRIPIPQEGPRGTVIFDWKAIQHASKTPDLCLTLGYNTAVFCAALRWRKIPNVINMDGLEWTRGKWGKMAKIWLRLNEWAACCLGNHLVADHPEIKVHLSAIAAPEKISTIAYGADRIISISAEPVLQRGLEPGHYFILVARPEPENSVLEVVSGFSAKRRNVKLAVLGHYRDSNAYHRAVKAAAGDEIVFLDAIYHKPDVPALRYHAAAYIHGHQVGGTNPSLVEALGVGNPVIAHDNRFNKWVAGTAARYFDGATSFGKVLDQILAKPEQLQQMGVASVERYEQEFAWPKILKEYESLLLRFLPLSQSADVKLGEISLKSKPSAR